MPGAARRPAAVRASIRRHHHGSWAAYDPPLGRAKRLPRLNFQAVSDTPRRFGWLGRKEQSQPGSHGSPQDHDDDERGPAPDRETGGADAGDQGEVKFQPSTIRQRRERDEEATNKNTPTA